MYSSGGTWLKAMKSSWLAVAACINGTTEVNSVFAIAVCVNSKTATFGIYYQKPFGSLLLHVSMARRRYLVDVIKKLCARH